MSIQVKNRQTGELFQEKVFGDFWLNFFYGNWASRSFISNAVIQKFASKVYGAYQSSTASQKMVDNFIHNFEINMENFQIPDGGYPNFNSFFTRKKKNGKTLFPENNNELGSPCDARLFVSKINAGKTTLHVKGKNVAVEDLLGGQQLGEDFDGGYALVFRLCPVDYHRFHFVDGGQCGEIRHFGSKLHSVNPVSLQKVPGVFLENERQVCFLDSEHFSRIWIIEVGAMCVGKIIQSFESKEKILRGQEKGYFEFGASTQILLLNNKIKLDEDLVENSTNGIETLVQTGEKIAEI